MAAVRAGTDILGLIGEFTPLKRVGRRYVGLCPFHAEKTASFSVNAEEGLYYCFGCQASGDAITFLRNIEGCDFVEAVERLAARAGIAVRRDDSGSDRPERAERQALQKVMEQAVAFYHEEMLSEPEAKRARQYLRSRGYEGGTVRQFRLGWAPENGRALVRSVRGPRDLLIKAGLAHEGQGGLRDAFRGRVIFPIFDSAGKAIGLGGRVLPGAGDEAGPKYRNSPETPIYSKRRTLYGLNWAKQAIVQTGEAVICEGYTDVIGFFTAGLPRAVATCGTALTEEHFRLLARFAKRVVLAFDADAAGQSAAARFYEWERRHELEVAVAALPAGSDPADIAMSEPQVLKEAAENAKSFLSFRVERALSSGEIKTAEGRAQGGRGGPRHGRGASQRARPRPVPRHGLGPHTPGPRTSPAAPRVARAGLRGPKGPAEATGRQTGGTGPPKGAEEAPAWEPDDEASFEPPPGPGPGPGVRRGPSAPGERAGRRGARARRPRARGHGREAARGALRRSAAARRTAGPARLGEPARGRRERRRRGGATLAAPGGDRTGRGPRPHRHRPRPCRGPGRPPRGGGRSPSGGGRRRLPTPRGGGIGHRLVEVGARNHAGTWGFGTDLGGRK